MHLLAQHPTGDGFRWVVVADAPLGPPAVVGRGGLPLELTEHTVVDADVAAALDLPAGRAPPDADADLLVVVARRHGVVVGRPRAGSTARWRSWAWWCAADERGTGVGSRTLEAAERAAERRGAATVSVVADDGDMAAFLRSRGYGGAEGAAALGRALTRRSGPTGEKR